VDVDANVGFYADSSKKQTATLSSSLQNLRSIQLGANLGATVSGTINAFRQVTSPSYATTFTESSHLSRHDGLNILREGTGAWFVCGRWLGRAVSVCMPLDGCKRVND
jgi:hypothetical protein